MTEQENILRLIEAAGPIARTPFPEWCARFAALVKTEAAVETYEACAKVCDAAFEQSTHTAKAMSSQGQIALSMIPAGGAEQAKKLATAFRAMGATPSREG